MYIVKTFPSHVLNANKVKGNILSNMQYVEARMLEDFEKTTDTWTHKPVFEHKVQYAGGNAIIEIGTNDAPWNYLNGGTNVRYLQLPRDFQRKTRPGWIGSSPGTHLDPKDKYINTNKPHPGITARKWTWMILDKYDDVLQKALDDAIRKGLQP